MSQKGKTGQRRALGKGLGALIPGAGAKGSKPQAGPREYFQCPVDRIAPDPDQPRRNFDKEALAQLVESIKEQGVIQPLIVRRLKDGYELIAGERRWRAAQMAGLREVPVVIKDATEQEAFEMALVENIQREDLNPIEEAEAYSRLVEDFGYSQSELASRVGKDRSTISNSLRLLGLPKEVKAMVLDGEITEGHARAVLQAGTPTAVAALAKTVATKGLSVRDTEKKARALAKGPSKAPSVAKEKLSPQVRSLTDRLQRALGTKVAIVDKKGKGKLEISYSSYEELDGILDKILR